MKKKLACPTPTPVPSCRAPEPPRQRDALARGADAGPNGRLAWALGGCVVAASLAYVRPALATPPTTIFDYDSTYTSPINPGVPSGTINLLEGASVTTSGGGNHAIAPYVASGLGAWTVNVEGRVTVTVTNPDILALYGIWLRNGGSVNVSGTGVIQAPTGIAIDGAAGNVVNDGSILGIQQGITLQKGGTVQNNATIQGGVIFQSGSAGTLHNSGTISGSYLNGFGVIMNSGGTFDNSGTASFTNANYAFHSYGDIAITNTGTINGAADSSYTTQVYGVLTQNGRADIDNSGLIHGRDLGLRVYNGSTADVSNSGTIQADVLDAVRLETTGEARYTQTAGTVTAGRTAIYTKTPAQSIIDISGGEVASGSTDASYGINIAGAGGASISIANASVTGTAAAIKGGAGTLDLSLLDGSRIRGGIIMGSGASSLTMSTGATLAGGAAGGGNSRLLLVGSGAGTAGDFSGFRSAQINAPGGTWTLTGASDFSAGTQVLAGTLAVNGSLGGALDVASGARLQGSGTVGDTTLESGATVAPGNSIGTLTVAGNLVFSNGAVYEVQGQPGGSASDLIHVTGSASLAGSVVHIGPSGGFAPENRYTILSADGGLNGTFDAVQSNFAFLDPSLGYDAHNVTLELDRNDIRFADKGATPNQRAVGQALDAAGKSGALYPAVVTLADGQVAQTFDALSGEVHASTLSALQANSPIVRNAAFDHLRANLGAGQLPGAPIASAGGALADSPGVMPRSAALPLWAQVVGNWQTLDGNGNAAGATQTTGGLFVGGDRGLGSGWRLGGALGYTHSRIDVDDRSSRSNVDSYSVAVYGGKALSYGPGSLKLLMGGAYTWHVADSARRVATAGLDQKLTADYRAETAQLFAELGYALPVGPASAVEPYAGLAWSSLHRHGFSESGGSAALRASAQTNDISATTMGIRVRHGLDLGQTEAGLSAMLGWRHAFGDTDAKSTLAFQDNSSFAVAGAPIARDAAVLELGADFRLARNITVGLSYSGQLGGGNSSNSGHLDARWRF